MSIWLWQFYDSRLTLHAFVLEQLGQTEYYNLRKEPEPPEKTSVFIVVFYDKVQINKKQQPLLNLKKKLLLAQLQKPPIFLAEQQQQKMSLVVLAPAGWPSNPGRAACQCTN